MENQIFYICIGCILLAFCVILAWISLHQKKAKKVIVEQLKKEAAEAELSSERKRQVQDAILRGIENKSFMVYFQPVFSKFDEIRAAEALARLTDPEYGEISPMEFVPVAIEMGRMNEIGLMVLEQVAKFIQENDMEQLGLKYIEVNLSACECRDSLLAKNIFAIIDKYEIPKHMINLQISEEALAENHSNLLHNMHMMNEEGINFSLDDYGSSAITLAYIMTLPFQFVKIDRSVLWTATKSKVAMDVLKASINTLKDFSMRIVVEGVESKEMADYLKKIGCDYLQGYYYAKPLCAKEFKDFCLTIDRG